MKTNERLRAEVLVIIENQLANDDPPETKLTFERLIKEGFNEFEAKQMIGQCVVVEIYEVLKQKKPFDKERYIKNLEQLPKEPFD